MTRLSELNVGDAGRLSAMECSPVLRLRLLELGFLPGATVRLVRRVPVAGLVEIECRGCHLSLRTSEAALIVLELA
jgi:Fe2+ transport system protein FeoA